MRSKSPFSMLYSKERLKAISCILHVCLCMYDLCSIHCLGALDICSIARGSEAPWDISR